MLRTGLANMGFGVLIALVGVVVTGVSYAMVGNGGGSYVVAYGAMIVGAWRFLLGLFQILRGAIAGPEVPTPPPPRGAVGPSSSSRSAGRIVAPDSSAALRIVGWALITDAALRTYSLGFVLRRFQVPVAEMFSNVQVLTFFVTAIILPALLIVGGIAAGLLLSRNRPGAIPFGIGLCVAGLLFQAYGVWRLLSITTFHVVWPTWAFVSVHFAILIGGLIILLRVSDRRDPATAAQAGRPDAYTSRVTRP